MPRIAVIGPGAIGSLAATWLCQDSNNQVIVCARTPFEDLSVETPDGVITAEPEVRLAPGARDPVDWILVATKAYDSAAAAAWFPSLLGEETQLAILQNGVDHVERFSLFLPAERILPVIVDCPTERVSPGKILQRGAATMDVPCSTTGASYCELFRNTDIAASQNSHFKEAAWRKLCINAAGVVNALTLQPARIANDEHAAYLMRRIVEEAVAVGLAEDVNLDSDLANEVVEIYRKQPGDSTNSLLADRMAGGPMEIDLRNGIIVKLGRRHGIPTPYNNMSVELLKVGG